MTRKHYPWNTNYYDPNGTKVEWGVDKTTLRADADERPCRKCGMPVFWDTNRNGKRYLGQRVATRYENGIGRWKQPHQCQPEQIAEYTEQLIKFDAEQVVLEAQRITDVAEGALVKGQTVTVFKGRKVPKGTEGVVFWIAPEADAYGVIKVGLTTTTGDKHFTNIENVKVTTQQGATK